MMPARESSLQLDSFTTEELLRLSMCLSQDYHRTGNEWYAEEAEAVARLADSRPDWPADAP